MSEGNGKSKWIVSAAIAAGAFLFGSGVVSGWITSIKTDAAFRQRTELHLDEARGFPDDIAELKTTVAVNNEQIRALTGLVTDLQDSQRRLGDKIDLLVQSQMREGRIPR